MLWYALVMQLKPRAIFHSEWGLLDLMSAVLPPPLPPLLPPPPDLNCKHSIAVVPTGPASHNKPRIRAVPAGPQLQALDRSGPSEWFNSKPWIRVADPNKPRIRVVFCRTWAASAWSQWSLPNPNSNLWIKVIPAGPQLQALDRSGPSGWSLPDLNCKRLIYRSGPCRSRTASPRSDWWTRTSPGSRTATSGSKWSPPDLNRKR